MRLKGEAPTIRRSLILHERSRDRLDALRETTEASSDSEIVRKALLYFEQLQEDIGKARQFFLRDDQDQDSPLMASLKEAEGERSETGGKMVKRNLILHPKSASRLDALRIKVKARSDSDLVRRAVALYDLLVRSSMAGKRLIARDADGKDTAYFIPVSRPAPHTAESLTRSIASMLP